MKSVVRKQAKLQTRDVLHVQLNTGLWSWYWEGLIMRANILLTNFFDTSTPAAEQLHILLVHSDLDHLGDKAKSVHQLELYPKCSAQWLHHQYGSAHF